MKLEFQSRWLRLLIEILPELPAMRRYRVTPARLEGATHRLLHQRIADTMRRRLREKAT